MSGKNFKLKSWKEKVINLIEDLIGDEERYLIMMYAAKTYDYYKEAN